MKFLIPAAILAVIAGSPATAAQLITNGTFDSGLSNWSVSGPVGASDIAVSTGNDYINYAGGSGSVSSATNSFASFGGGNVPNVSTLSQTFNTVIGATYTYSFDYGAFGGQQVFSYSVGSTSGSASVSYGSDLDTAFLTDTGTFVGTGLPTTISFTLDGQPTNNVDGFIDNVSVTGAVPEPATWAMMLAGFGMIGFALRARRQSGTLAAA